MKKMLLVLLIALSLGMFTACTTLEKSEPASFDDSDPMLGTWINIDTYLYEEKEETATCTIHFADSTFIIDTVFTGEDYIEYVSENGTYTYTDDTLNLTLASHTDAEGITYDGEELLSTGMAESLSSEHAYFFTEREGVRTLTIDGSQEFIKQ